MSAWSTPSVMLLPMNTRLHVLDARRRAEASPPPARHASSTNNISLFISSNLFSMYRRHDAIKPNPTVRRLRPAAAFIKSDPPLNPLLGGDFGRRAPITKRSERTTVLAVALKLRVVRRARERDHIAYVAHARDEEQQTLEAQSEARVGRRAPSGGYRDTTRYRPRSFRVPSLLQKVCHSRPRAPNRLLSRLFWGTAHPSRARCGRPRSASCRRP